MYALRIHRLNKKERRQQNNKTKKLMKAENKIKKNRRARGGDEGLLPLFFLSRF
jgi:hypothetical protein